MTFNYIYMVEFAEKYAANNTDVTILDYGCGSGDVVIAGRERGLNFFGADVFYGGAESAKARIKKSGLMGVAVKEIIDGKLDFPDRTFDLVVCNQVFEHVEDLDAVLFEIHRVLKPGGSLLSLFPTLDTWREGHCGIPFVHRFLRTSNARYFYALFLRRLGFGSHKDEWKTPEQWTEHKLQWLDRYCHYRDGKTIHKAFTKYFAVRAFEDDYILARLNKSRLSFFSPLVKFPLIKQIMMEVLRKFGGSVMLATKPMESQGM